MYLRQTKRTNKDGSVVSYLQLAHNERHPVTGAPTAKVIHNFGRAEKVDRDALARLVASISRLLTPEQAAVAAAAGEVQVLDSRRLGGAWVLERLRERLGIGAAIRRVAAGRRLDAVQVERVLFALVAQRALEPGSKLAATTWVAERVAIVGCTGFSADAAYAGMDFLLQALDEIASEIFASVAPLLNLDIDLVFVDTTSTYWETERLEMLPDLQEDTVGDTGAGGDGQEPGRPVESGRRAFGHSKDRRPDLPQVVIAMAVTRDGVPIRCWTFPGSENDQAIIRTVKDDLGAWNLRRLVWAVHGLRPVFHHREDRVRAHVQLCWLALLLIRVAENATGDTWRNLRHELDRMHLVTLASEHGTVAQRSVTTPGQKSILTGLGLPEPPRFFDFTTD